MYVGLQRKSTYPDLNVKLARILWENGKGWKKVCNLIGFLTETISSDLKLVNQQNNRESSTTETYVLGLEYQVGIHFLKER